MMAAKNRIAELLFKGVSSGKISFNSALKIYRRIDPLFARHKSPSGRFSRASVIKHLIDSTEKGAHTAWTSVAFPAELLYPFGVYPMTLEVMAGLLATLDLSRIFLDIADAGDIPATMCSFHRCLLGVAKTGFIGRPAFVGATSILCDGNLKSFSEAAKMQSAPFLFIDIPYRSSADAVEYVKSQLKEVIRSLEDLSGTMFDEAAFREVAGKVNETFRLVRRFHELRRRSRKNLYMGYEVANFTFPMHFMLGSNTLVDVYRNMCDDIESGKEHHRFYKSLEYNSSARRLMWLHIVPQFDSGLWSVIDNGENARIVCDEYSSPYFDDYDVSDPLGSIAKRLIDHPANGPIERRIDNILKIAKDYDVEGIIHYSSWGCHQAAGNVQLIGKAIRDAGYSFLNLNGDPVDRRNTSSEQHRTRLEAFLEN